MAAPRHARRPRVASTLLVAVVMLSACLPVSLVRRPSGPPDPGRIRKDPGAPTPPIERSVTPWLDEVGPLSRKAVTAKEPPARLVAVDGTSCLVPEKRFAQVSVGELVWCHWQERAA